MDRMKTRQKAPPHFVRLLLTRQDRLLLEEIASRNDDSLSKTVRRLIRQEAMRSNSALAEYVGVHE